MAYIFSGACTEIVTCTQYGPCSANQIDFTMQQLIVTYDATTQATSGENPLVVFSPQAGSTVTTKIPTTIDSTLWWNFSARKSDTSQETLTTQFTWTITMTVDGVVTFKSPAGNEYTDTLDGHLKGISTDIQMGFENFPSGSCREIKIPSTFNPDGKLR